MRLLLVSDQGNIMPRIMNSSMAAITPETGTVITQAAAIFNSAERLTSA